MFATTPPPAAFAARVAGSLNHHLGHDAMNASDEVQFITLAIDLGSRPARLQAVRQQLAQCATDSGLFDMDAFALDFSALVQRMAQRHRRACPARTCPSCTCCARLSA